MFEEIRREKEITIEVKNSSPLPQFFCAESLIRRALANIIDNALKYTPRQGRIEIHTRAFLNKKNKGFLKIAVRDNGIGIHADDLPKIFDPFYRGKNVRHQEGTGLGLQFVKKAIEFHGGKLFVRSKVNLGSVFFIILPLNEDKLDIKT